MTVLSTLALSPGRIESGSRGPFLGVEEGAVGGAVVVLHRAAAGRGVDEFDALAFLQHFDVVADVADRLPQLLRDFVRAGDPFVEDGQGVNPDRVAHGSDQALVDGAAMAALPSRRPAWFSWSWRGSRRISDLRG